MGINFYKFTEGYLGSRYVLFFLLCSPAKPDLTHDIFKAAILTQSAFATIDHYQEVKADDKEVDFYLRLFLLPGVLHCVGGTGPDKTDWLALVMDWVEKGVGPERVVMSKIENGEIVMERPVFPYPSVAEHDGEGDPRKESSFSKK